MTSARLVCINSICFRPLLRVSSGERMTPIISSDLLKMCNGPMEPWPFRMVFLKVNDNFLVPVVFPPKPSDGSELLCNHIDHGSTSGYVKSKARNTEDLVVIERVI